MRKSISLAFVLVMLMAGFAQAQTVVTIYDLQQDLILVGTEVTVEGVVVSALDLVSGGQGFFAQEAAGGPHSGIYIYMGPAGPTDLAVGDIVDITGTYDEYFGLAEILLTGVGASYTIVGSTVPPTPVLLRASDLQTYVPVAAGTAGTLNPAAEQWECVLAKVENVRVIDLSEGYGSWYGEEFGFAVNDTLLFDDDLEAAAPPLATEMSSVTGVIWYHHDFYRLTPRTAADIVYSGAAPAPQLEYAVATGAATIDVRFDREVEVTTAQNAFHYFIDVGTVTTAVLDATDNQLVHLTLALDMTAEQLLTLTVFDVQNTDGVPMLPTATQFWGNLNTLAFVQAPDAGGDSSAIAGDVVTVRAVVHSKFDVWGSHVYLQEVNGARSGYNGIEAYMPAHIDDVAIGDILVIGDPLSEYYNMTSLSAPYYYFEIESSGNTVLDPEVVTIGDPTDITHWEQHEGGLVKVENVVVVERGFNANFYEWAVTQDDLIWLRVGDMGDYGYIEGLGDTLNITGVVRYEYGEYKLHPRSDADIEILYQNPNNAGDLPAGAKIALAQNHPNPFNPRTKISFQLAEPGVARVEVFDAQGRLVKSLFSGRLDAGPHEVVWQGDTDGGDSAVTGLYFYKLSANGASETRKMLMLK